MNEPVTYLKQVHDLEEVIRTMVTDEEIVTHFDLIVSTRLVSDPRLGRSHRFSLPGADPEVSLGKMIAACDRLRARLIEKQGGSDAH